MFTPVALSTEVDDLCFIEPQNNDEILQGQYLMSEIELLENDLALDIDTALALALPLSSTASNDSYILEEHGNDTRKNPTINNGYYTINGNKDIVILGHEKQLLYANATTEWNINASFTFAIENVGYLVYNNIILDDTYALETNTDYSEFIYNVQINGFSKNYEYRLELNNGQVTLWSKLPGNNVIPSIPEPTTTALCLLIILILLAYNRKRK